MRILILGAGALGGYFGARLLAAGRDVTFLVRPRSAQQLAERGLRVLSPSHGDVWIQHARTVQAQELHEPYDVVMLSCKAYDLAGSMDSIAAAVGPQTIILPMLNGMAHMAQLDARFGQERVLGGTCFISAVRDPDGTIRHLNDRDGLFFGDRNDPASDRMEQLKATMAGCNFTSQLRPVILQDMWEKWSFLATLAGATCLMRATLGDIQSVDATFAVRMYAECCDIAAAAGFSPALEFRTVHRSILSKPGSNLTASMLRDLEDGAAVESHQILGDLLGYGSRYGIASPLLQVAHNHVRCYQLRRLRQGNS
jgi:2-dehydropantoate 2-reductase